MTEGKRELRARMRALRRKVAAAERAGHAARLAGKLLARDEVMAAIRAHAPICVYLAGPEEIDLDPFIAGVRARGGSLCAPRWNGATYTLARLGDTVREGPHGIREPAEDVPVSPADVAVWIAPGLAFTPEGLRLGYGGGWYDRFFAAAAPRAARLGVAYPFQMLASLPTEAHDRPLTEIVTAAEPENIAFLDSGVGGLSVWRAVREMLPGESTDYLGDAAHCPYGPRSPEDIRRLTRKHVRLLLARGAKLVVVACNTATAAAVDDLRRTWPEIPFVGMEPAVKPAALHSKTGTVGVLATEGTFHGRLYRETTARCAAGTKVLTCVADEFVTLVEQGLLEGPEVEAAVRARVAPLLAAGVDQLVLGCTHFPFLAPVIARVAAGRATVVDPAPAVARQVSRLLAVRGLSRGARANPPNRWFETTGDRESFAAFLQRLETEK